MKKFILVALLVVTASLTGQEIAITNASVVGKWELYDIINTKLSTEELAENKSLLEGSFLQFKADKTCVLGIIMDLDGTWQLDAARKIITTETRRGETSWKIHSLQKDKITLSRNDVEQKIIFKKL